MGAPKTTIALLLSALLAGCSPGAPDSQQSPTPSPAGTTATVQQATVKGTVRTNKTTPLSLRAQPSTASKRLTRIPHKTTISLACKTIGDTVSNGVKASNVWNKVTYKKRTGYVASVFVDGGDSAALSLCQDSTGTPSPSATVRPPNVEAAIVKVARSQRGVTEKKNNCNPYGGCMPWSSLFATWAWNKAGNVVPRFSFSGDLFAWGELHNRSHSGTDGVGPGDLVLFGTKPDNPKTSTRVDIVTEVLADGRLKVIGGDYKGKVVERTVALKGIYGWVDA
ncbi:SH3 domain-containing protein [Micropruina sp.]|uniref:SH3 domain-containing protein n=1 Tax=Micropruina sp. TaxID=2737536 RepID=UPI0039E3DDF4